MCYDPIRDATRAPPFGSQRRRETSQEVLERFWHETLSTNREFLNRAIFSHFAIGINPNPWLAGYMASVLCVPDYLA